MVDKAVRADDAENSNQIARTNQDSTVSNGEEQQGEQAEQRQPSHLESFLGITKTLIVRALIIYLITSFFRRPQPDNQSSTAPALAKTTAFNIFENGAFLDLYVYLSEDPNFRNYSDSSSLIWKQEDLQYGDWTAGPAGDGSFSFVTKFTPSEHLKNNGSIYLHVFFIKSSALTPKERNSEAKFTSKHAVKQVKQLNRFKKLKFIKTQNLLTGKTTLTEAEIKKAETLKSEIVSHWHPNVTVNLVADQTAWSPATIPAPLNEYIEFSPTGDFYKPIVFFNEFWNMNRDYRPINDTTEELDLHITYQPISLIRWQIYSAQSMRNKWTSNLLGDTFAEEEDEDQDSLKEALLETSPYLIALTVAVSLLHSVFELLAFKNDIQFWNNRKSLEGLSVRSVFFNVFQSLVVLLYVLDNEANFLIKVSCFIGLGIEVWKINKVVDFKIDRERPKILGVIPRLTFTDKGSYVESSTKVYDELAFKYLSIVLYPLLGGYAIYSLIYLEHKGWYSWVLNMLYGFLLTFGFIMMTPQLFINYKLKSVAHLPWRMMSYKCLNTFIDDIFAFVIKMPTMYRLGCFRDDIVFFIFLYQRWIYRVDPKRVNEFGYSGEMEEPTEMPVQETLPIEEKQKEEKKKDK
nr:PREDICTED: cleft lip and palate transmembrane protein 1 homolog [Bemisia tabaci]